MTVQPTRDQRVMWRQIATDAGDDPYANTLHPEEVLALLDQLDQADAELDSWMTRAYEAEKRAWRAETRLAGWMEHWNATARTGAVDEVAAILEANSRADQAEARIKAVRDVLDNPIRLVDWDDPLVPAAHVRRALDG